MSNRILSDHPDLSHCEPFWCFLLPLSDSKGNLIGVYHITLTILIASLFGFVHFFFPESKGCLIRFYRNTMTILTASLFDFSSSSPRVQNLPWASRRGSPRRTKKQCFRYKDFITNPYSKMHLWFCKFCSLVLPSCSCVCLPFSFWLPQRIR